MRSMLMAPIGRPSRSPISNPVAVGRPVPPPASFDDSELRRRLRALEGRRVPQFDPSALQQRIAGLQDQFANFRQFDPTNLQSQIGGLQDRLANFRQFDDSALRRRLQALEGRQMPRFDDTDLRNRLQALEGREIPQFDPSQLQAGIQGLSDRISNIPQFDPSRLQERLSALENVQPVAPTPAFDPSGLIARLDDFETRLGAMQQPLPIQPPGDLNLDIKEDAPDIRDLAKELPEGGTIFDRLPVQKPTPPMSIERLGEDRLVGAPVGNLQMGTGVPFRPIEPPQDDGTMNDRPRIGNYGLEREPQPSLTIPVSGEGTNFRPQPPISIGGPGGGRTDPRMFPGGSRTFDERGETLDPLAAPDNLVTTGPDNIGGAPSLVDQQMQQGAIDPVLMNQQASEVLTDPLIRSLYFGTADQPGFFQQLQQAGANLIGSDVPLQQTAGLSPLELLARQQAVAGLGGFEPFLQQNRELINQAIEQSRRAEGLQDPYYTQAEEIYKDTMGAYDPSMTQQFFNPFEDAVVQQTIDDVLEAGEQQDIAARAQEIGSGAFGGSRARLGAMERREALGEGLAQALGNIRQRGFSEAQRTGLSEFARQQAAKRTGAQGLIGIGVGRGSAAQQLGQQLAGYGGQMGGLGATQEQLRAGQRGELAGFGGIGRGIAETGLQRIYEQQLGQQFRPLQVLGQISGMLPGYQASTTRIDSQYGMPTDPTAAGLGAAFSAYGALAPRQGTS